MAAVSTTHKIAARLFRHSIRYSCSSSSLDNDSPAFCRASHGVFKHTPPQLYNTFIEDGFLRECLSQRLPSDVREEIFPDLERLGSRVAQELEPIGREAEENPPTLKQYDAWGNRVDDLVTSTAWRKMHDVAAEEGLVGVAYERKHSQWSRLHQFAKLYLYNPSSGLYSCPLAMTDGAAKLIETVKESSLMERAYARLISRDPDKFWTSGQWMTEMGGGSDVAGGTATVATPIDLPSSNTHLLHGYKWFSSATDANMAFTLARVINDDGKVIEGTRGLSLFYVETRKSDGTLNNILIECLKNKLGTRQLPTAELLLDGTEAQLVGEQGRGVAGISPMLTITRLHNAITSVALMRRMMQLSRDYSTKRKAFGRFIADYPLHTRTLAELELETRGCTLLTLQMSELLGKEECNVHTIEDNLLLRVMMPVAKLYTAKKAVELLSEGLETFGGQGYIEGTGLPTAYRDAQVLPIWEGTTNILSLDVLRALQKTNGEALQALVNHVKMATSCAQRLQQLGLLEVAESLNDKMSIIAGFYSKASEEDPAIIPTAARDMAYSIAHVYIGSLLLQKACHKEMSTLDVITAKRWCSRVLPLQANNCYQSSVSKEDLHLVMDSYQLSLKQNK